MTLPNWFCAYRDWQWFGFSGPGGCDGEKPKPEGRELPQAEKQKSASEAEKTTIDKAAPASVAYTAYLMKLFDDIESEGTTEEPAPSAFKSKSNKAIVNKEAPAAEPAKTFKQLLIAAGK